jgi:Tfp pilus assembly protein PilF/MoaA/NifB/PqqE/SkfB family radical SAM enzyme
MMQENIRNHIKLGQGYRENKDYGLAIDELMQALEIDSENAQLHLELGRTYREKRDFSMAEKELSKAMELSPCNVEVYLELARTYRENEEYPKAIEQLNAALSHNPPDGRIHLELGRVYHRIKELELAIKELDNAVELGLDNYEVHLEMARVYRQKGEYAKSVEEFKAALRYKPSDARMHLELGWLYYDNEDYDLSLKELEEAVSCGIDTDELHISLGRIYRKAGAYERSAEEFKKAIEKSPNQDDLFFRNKVLNEIEISQKKTILESKPIGLGITLTNKCNLKCRICGVWKQEWEIPGKVIREIIKLFPYLERIVWQGGEVFLLDYFDTLFEKASSYPHLKQTIITNGILINERRAEKLARNNVAIIYSIDAITKDAYEYIVGQGAKFEDLIQSISLVNEYRKRHDCHKDPFNKMATIINVVVMESNYRYLDKFMDFARDYQFDEIQLVPLLGIRGPENIFLNQDRNAGEYLAEVMPLIERKARDYEIILHNWLPPIADAQKPQSGLAPGKDKPRKCCDSICYLPWQQMFMTPDHKLKPGCYCSRDIGDINISSLEDIWNGQVMQLYRQKMLAGEYAGLCDSVCVSGVIPQRELKVSRYG